MKFGLDYNTINNLTAVFEQFSKVDEAFIFGSRAKGNYRPDSDIDIAIKGQDIYTDDIIAISIAFEEKGITHKIDLINYNTINEPALKDHIDRVGIEFFSSWKEYRFSDFVSINPTVSLKGSDEYSFVEMKDLQDGNKICSPSAKRKTSSGARFQERDTLFARITPCLENGKICQVRDLENGIGFGSTEFLVFRGKKEVSNNDFVFYLSRWNEVRDFAENNFEGTSGRQRVPKNCFKNLKLKLPPLKEQTAIASILSSLDDKIDLLHRQNKTLEELAETLFNQWFVEEADDNWDAKPLKEVCHIINGFAFKSEDYRENGRIIIRTKNFENGYVNIDDTIFIDLEEEVKYLKHQLKRFDFLLVMVGASIGKFAIVTSDVLPALQNQNMWNFRTLGILPQHYLNFAIRSIIKDNIGNVSGSARDFFQKGQFYEFLIPIPNSIKLDKFNSLCEEYFTKIESNRMQIRTLTMTRETLLPKLMNGDVRVNL